MTDAGFFELDDLVKALRADGAVCIVITSTDPRLGLSNTWRSKG